MSDSYSIEIEGLDKLISKLQGSVKDEVILSSLKLSGLLLAGWSKQNRLSGPRPQILGVRTGRLRSSITAGEPIKSGNVYSEDIGTNVEYASIHEFGGFTGRNGKVFIPARPFLRPSLEDVNNRNRILDILTKNINEQLEK